jgi:hypothetical protein
MAEAVDRLVAEVKAPPTGRSAAAPISRREVVEAEPNLRELADRLSSESPLEARGVVLAERLLGDVTSPVYTYDGPGALAHAVRVATRALG